MRTNHACPTIFSLRRERWVRVGHAGFTLTELLVVIAIISLLIGVLVLGVRGLNGSTSRRAAVGTLMGVFDQARAVAISDGRATYVVFVSAPDGVEIGTDAVAATMWGRAYALFEDPVLTDAVTTDNASTTFQPQQRSNWLYLPTGVAFKSDNNGDDKLTSLTNSAPVTGDTKFKVPTTNGPTALSLPYVKFDSAGQIVTHSTSAQVMDPSSALLRVLLFEGMTNSTGKETVLHRNAGTSGTNVKYGLDEILLKPTTGRAKYTLDPSSNLATPTPTP